MSDNASFTGSSTDLAAKLTQKYKDNPASAKPGYNKSVYDYTKIEVADNGDIIRTQIAGKSQAHHIIPYDIFNEKDKVSGGLTKTAQDIRTFFEELADFGNGDGTMGFHPDSAENGIFLPQDEESAKGAQNKGTFAARHQGNHHSYTNFVRERMKDIVKTYELEKRDLRSKEYTTLEELKNAEYQIAKRARDRVSVLQNNLRNGLMSNSIDNVRFILNNYDPILPEKGIPYFNSDVNDNLKEHVFDKLEKDRDFVKGMTTEDGYLSQRVDANGKILLSEEIVEKDKQRLAEAKASGNIAERDLALKNLQKAGWLGAIVGAGFTINSAHAAYYEEGDPGKAGNILGGALAGGIGGAIGGAGLVGAVVVVSGPVGWGVAALVGVVGGIGGSLAGEKVFDEFFAFDEKELSTHIGNTVVKDYETTGLKWSVLDSPEYASLDLTSGEPILTVPEQDGLGTDTEGQIVRRTFVNGDTYEEYRGHNTPLDDHNVMTVTVPGKGTRKTITYMNPGKQGNLNYKQGNPISTVYEYDADGNLLRIETERLTADGGFYLEAKDANGNVFAERVSKQVGDKWVEATFVNNDEDSKPVKVIVNNETIDNENALNELYGDKSFTPKGLLNGEISDDTNAILENYDLISPSGFQTLLDGINEYGNTILDSLRLFDAIQNGEPLPIIRSGLNLVEGVVNPVNLDGNVQYTPETYNYNLAGATNVAGGISSLLSLNAALENDDTLGAITSGASLINYGASAYANFAEGTSLSAALENTDAFGDAAGAVGAVGKALPYLNLVQSIKSGDKASVAVSTLTILAQNNIITGSLAAAVPYIGWTYAAVNLVKGLFGGDDPDPWGHGRFVWDGESGIRYSAAGEAGGHEAVSGVMQNTLASLNALIDTQVQAYPESQLGIIPNRMPTVGYDLSGYRYSDIDPLTGIQQHAGLRFDVNGQPYNAEVGSEESFMNLNQAMLVSALERQAIAPQWEVLTARLQSQAGDPKAGMTEEARAGQDGELADELTGEPQTFRPITLDLSGDDRINTLVKEEGVFFDVDDSGYLKQTGWVAPEDGFLVLDRNFNGSYDTGKELFSNSTVSLDRRGLGALAWVDANYDGRITAVDPVWNELKVWQDNNQNGTQEEGEVTSLLNKGITSLNYGLSTYNTSSGETRKLASPDLEANAEGTNVSVVEEGILIQSSDDGSFSLVVTRVVSDDDGNTGIGGIEDTETIIDPALLLAELSETFGTDLTLVDLTNVRHGEAYIDDNGLVHFMPEENYTGSDVGFDYVVQASGGVERTVTVDVSLAEVGDAPELVETDKEILPVYGYSPIDTYGLHPIHGRGIREGYISGGHAIHSPYVIETYISGRSGFRYTYSERVILNPPLDLKSSYDQANYHVYSYRTTPIFYEESGLGNIVAHDPDGDSSLTFELVNAPQYGEVTISAEGAYQYKSWESRGIVSDQVFYGGDYTYVDEHNRIYKPSKSDNWGLTYVRPELDAFQVRISDESGNSTVETIEVQHIGPYIVSTPTGGGSKPIAVDLDGDGAEFTDIDDSDVFFDINDDGWKENISWVGSGDGLLGFDIDQDGLITGSGEISFARYLDGAQTDLEGLNAFDSNQNGYLDNGDDAWERFGIWQDANSNGITDEGEFKSLDEHGIATISLQSDGQFEVVDGQTVHGTGDITMRDGGSLTFTDVTLAYSNEVQTADGNTITKKPFSTPGEEIHGTEETDLIPGKNADNIVYGYAGDDVIIEDIGNDIIEAGEGNDQVYGGADNDMINGDAGDDAIYAGLGNDMVFGSDGHDAILMEGGNDVAFGGDGNDFVSGGVGNDVLSGNQGNDQVIGEAGNDALFGQEGHDELIGLTGHDMLDGGEGDDLLAGGEGEDEMSGGSGDDTYVVDNLGDQVIEQANQGSDTVRTNLNNYTLSEHLENLALIGEESLSGTGNAADNRLQGNLANNHLIGLAGNDTLDGNQGADTLEGGTGDDRYYIDHASDQIIEIAGQGTDSVYSNIAYTLGEHTEHLFLTGTSAINGTGNASANILRGNNNANSLDGKAGADDMAGGQGSDSYIVDQADDIVTEFAHEGSDTIITHLSYTLSEHIENLILTGTDNTSATGNSLSNILVGNDGNNTLDGQTGADQMAGGKGDDTYHVDHENDIIVELADQGNELVNSAISHTLAEHVENLTLTGTDHINGIGNALNNTITANSGNNTIDGQAGTDTLIGGGGSDTYIITDTTDAIVEQAGQGFDQVNSSVSFTLAEHVENLTLTGTDNINGSGNSANNKITGNSGNNILDGQTGEDTLIGGAGNDTYVIDNENDQITELFDQGKDQVNSSINFVLPEYLEDLTLTGSADINGSGNAVNNTILGNNGSNTLNGLDGDDVLNAQGGHDILIGGLGNDSLQGGAGDDQFLIEQNQGVDLLADTSGTDTVKFGEGFDSSNTILRITETKSGEYKARMYQLNEKGCEITDYGFEFLVASDGEGGFVSPIERFEFSDGSVKTFDDLQIKTVITHGTAHDIEITTDHHDDIIYAGPKDNIVQSGSGYDTIYGEAGDDHINAQGGHDYLQGDTGNDTLEGGCGVDVLAGNNGDDVLRNEEGHGVLLGGRQDDSLTAGDGNDFLAGGKQDDRLTTGAGNNIIAYNKGDRQDDIFGSEGANNTLSLGGGIQAGDLGLARSDNHLILQASANGNDQITFRDWYSNEQARNLNTLQIIHSASEIAQYDFQAVVAEFDAQYSAADTTESKAKGKGKTKVNAWAVMDSLLDAHLSQSDSQALGGEMAVSYAEHGALAMTTGHIQSIVRDQRFGLQQQKVSEDALTSVKIG